MSQFIAYAGPRTWKMFDDISDAVRWAQDLGYPITMYRKMETPDVVCTGLTASWCPICGDCCCDSEEGLDDPSCPLHAIGTPHPYAHYEEHYDRETAESPDGSR